MAEIASPKIFVTQFFEKIMMPDSLPKKSPGRPKGAKSRKTLLREKIAQELAIRNQLADDIRMLLPLGVRKKGIEALKTLSKEEIEKEVTTRLGHQAHKLINAQLSLALGSQSLFRVVKGVDEYGKTKIQHVLVTDPEEIRECLDDPLMVKGSDYYYITTRDPDNNAINALLDRVLGKASSKIVGPNNPDGSEGPIKVIVANFSADNQSATPSTSQIADAAPVAALEPVRQVISDQILASVEDEVFPEDAQKEHGNSFTVTEYGNSDTTQV